MAHNSSKSIKLYSFQHAYKNYESFNMTNDFFSKKILEIKLLQNDA